MSVKINGNNPLGPMNQVKKVTDNLGVKTPDKKQASDRVDFSSVLQEVSSAKETTQAGAAEHTARVQEIKEQVSNGTYKPDMLKVAASLLRFIVGGRQ